MFLLFSPWGDSWFIMLHYKKFWPTCWLRCLAHFAVFCLYLYSSFFTDVSVTVMHIALVKSTHTHTLTWQKKFQFSVEIFTVLTNLRRLCQSLILQGLLPASSPWTVWDNRRRKSLSIHPVKCSWAKHLTRNHSCEAAEFQKTSMDEAAARHECVQMYEWEAKYCRLDESSADVLLKGQKIEKVVGAVQGNRILNHQVTRWSHKAAMRAEWIRNKDMSLTNLHKMFSFL